MPRAVPRLQRNLLAICFTVLRFLASVLLLCGSPSSALSGRGVWSPPRTSTGTAIHMALLRGDGSPYHSRVIWWESEGVSTFVGNQLGWRIRDDDGCIAYPDSALISIGLP